MRRIKLIWDFRRPDAAHFAAHHARHLQEFLQKENLTDIETGEEILDKNYAIAFMVVDEADMIKFRDLLKPHRAVYAS